jgi:hypothetical protein
VGRCRTSAKKLDRKGTAVPKDTHHVRTADRWPLELPESMIVAVAELAGRRQRGILDRPAR